MYYGLVLFHLLFGMLLDHSVDDVLVNCCLLLKWWSTTRLVGGIKQEIHEFKTEFNSLLADLKNEIQTKFGNIK